MYLTKIEIDSRRRESGRILSSPHRMHGAVNSCFPPSVDLGRVLWRVDVLESGTALYILSEPEPDPTGLVERCGWPRAQAWQTREYSPVLDAVRDGRRFAFRVRVNPVRSVRPQAEVPSGGHLPRGTRVGHVTAEQQLEWFVGRAAAWGFDVSGSEEPTCRIVERRNWSFDRRGNPVTVSTAVIEGELAVTETAVMLRSLQRGIGPAKAYGCGLLTLADPATR